MIDEINLASVTTITDFTDLTTNHMSRVGANVEIADGANTIIIENVALADLLDGDDFVFV